ncbi:MAG TPA: hypothetical protein VFG10_07115 [Saprospiraceae bacterium]|nr:hypothetical protein [Saprospiraceae bacterium]
MSSVVEINSLLSQLKTKILVFGVAFRGRDKNLQALLDLDITPKQREDYLKDLTSDNYYSGPNPDRDVPGKPDYYEFGLVINNKNVYIKLSPGLSGKMVDCISFHVAEWPLKFPLKSQPNEEDN